MDGIAGVVQIRNPQVAEIKKHKKKKGNKMNKVLAAAAIENLINGNLSDAKRQAKRITYREFREVAGDYFGALKAHCAAEYLKNPNDKTYQNYCNADMRT